MSTVSTFLIWLLKKCDLCCISAGAIGMSPHKNSIPENPPESIKLHEEERIREQSELGVKKNLCFFFFLTVTKIKP
jgi:hypothetical protein